MENQTAVFKHKRISYITAFKLLQRTKSEYTKVQSTYKVTD